MEREEAYRIIADMVYKGFFSLYANFAGNTFIFKTVNNREYDLIKYYSGVTDSPYQINIFNSYFLAFSVFMINQKNVLVERDKNVKELYSFFNSMPSIFCKVAMKELDNLRAKTYEAMDFIEGFSYSSQNRKMWRVLGTNSSDKIPGVENLGLNVFQENWILINKNLDEEERYNEQFSLAVLIASSTNAKGAKQLRAKHDANIKAVEEKRKKLSMAGSSTMKSINWSEQGWAMPVDTAEDLIAELERQMHGLKDKHDRFIEKYMADLEANAERHNKEAQQRLEEFSKKHEGENPLSGEQRALTPDEAKELMSKKSNNLVVLPPEDMATIEEKERFLTKVGGKILTGRRN